MISDNDCHVMTQDSSVSDDQKEWVRSGFELVHISGKRFNQHASLIMTASHISSCCITLNCVGISG